MKKIFITKKMKNILRISAGAIVVTGLVAFLTITGTIGEKDECVNLGLGYRDGACVVEKGKQYEKVIVITGNTNNSPDLDFDDKTPDFRRAMYGAMASGANIKFVSVAPTSDVLYNEEFNGHYSARDLNNNYKKMKDSVDKKEPMSDGADYYGALYDAAREIGNTDGNGLIIVVGSGLSDRGLLNFASGNLLHADSDTVLSSLERAKALTNKFRGIDVKWLYQGKTIAPQEVLSKTEIDNLGRIYENVLESQGATVSYLNGVAKKDWKNYDYKVKVTPVVVDESVVIDTISDSEIGGFKPNSTEFNDETKADQSLADTIVKAKENNKKIVVTGFIASGSCDNSKKDTSLALGRAEAIKQRFVKNGVDASRIEVVSGGIPDGEECPNGVWSEDAAKIKRRVEIKIG